MNKIKNFFSNLLAWVKCVWWSLVLWQKRQCGFIDLGKEVEVVGTIRGVVLPTDNFDGDFCFDILPDPGYEWLLYYDGKKLVDVDSPPNCLHIEYTPCWTKGALLQTLNEAARRFKAGEIVKVCIKGSWAVDAVHIGVAEWKEVILCLFRHKPQFNEHTSTEIHPAKTMEILS